MNKDEISVINLNELLEHIEALNGFKNILKDKINNNFSERKRIISVELNGEKIEMNLGLLLLNLYLINSFSKLNIKIDSSYLYKDRKITQDDLAEYINRLIIKCKSHGVDSDSIRDGIYDSINEMSDSSGNYNVLKGNTLSYLDLIRLEATDPEVKEIFNPDVKTGSFSDLEELFNDYGKRFINYFKTHKDNELHQYVLSETGINKKQATQFACFVGLKPDIDGSVIPVVIKENFLHGLNSIQSFYINCKGTRKALITNNKMTRRSGYLTRKLSLSNIDRYHDNSIESCTGLHDVKVLIQNKKKLDMFIGRHYYELDSDGNRTSELKTIDQNSEHLIGQYIGVRSPVTCGCKKCVCATCYGKNLSEVNKDANTGLVAVLKITEPLTQRLLSSKHLLSTNTEKINWPEEFKDIFQIDMDSMYFLDDVECSVSFTKPTEDEFDEEENAYYTYKISILYDGSKKAIDVTSPTRLFINPKFTTNERMKDDSDSIKIRTKDVDEDTYVFKYPVKNNELTRSLQEILDLIESSGHLGITDYNEIVNKFDDLLISNGLDYIKSVHAEMIISNLIKEAGTRKRLDFSKSMLDDYDIVRVSKSIQDAPLSVSFAFERIPEQLVDLETYNKTEKSMMDNLYL